MVVALLNASFTSAMASLCFSSHQVRTSLSIDTPPLSVSTVGCSGQPHSSNRSFFICGPDRRLSFGLPAADRKHRVARMIRICCLRRILRRTGWSSSAPESSHCISVSVNSRSTLTYLSQ